ncbi:MAG: hypothetical protein N3H30_02520 [Candidatus Micrarchaeota archaeon]|nr:hypothetical protein [Candidatus Micrarchaeota archaeon]
MGFSITRSQAIQAIVVLVAIAFILSTISMWFSGKGAQQLPAATPTGDENASVEAVVATGNILLTLDAYSPAMRIYGPSAEATEYISQLQSNGTITYVDTSNAQYTTIALSDAGKVYEVGTRLRRLSPNSTIALEAYVSSSEEFNFSTANGTVRARIPRSKTVIMYPYKVGSKIPFKALVQIYDGQVVAGKLTLLAIERDVRLPVAISSLGDKYYARLFFSWRDRVAVNESIQGLVSALEAIGARDVQTNFIRDDTVYLSRALTDEEAEQLKRELEGVKAVQMSRVILYSNYSYTEDEVSDAIHSAAGNSTEVTFSMPMLELAFSGNLSDDAVASAFSGYSYTPLHKYVYRLANVTTGGVSVTAGDYEYYVNDMSLTVWVPLGAGEGTLQPLDFTVDIMGEEIVSATQKLPEGR